MTSMNLLRVAALGGLLLAPAAAESLRVMTFNVRMPSKGDGENVWERRRDLLAATIREKNPDVFGTQELYYEQGEYIAAQLPEYAWFGVSRRGNRTDEHMGVFYRKDALKLVESGNFWLSETPETPGSMSWDVTLPRMVTWGLFETRGGRRFYFYNTHFPHRKEDAAARVKCAEVIARRIAALPAGTAFVLTGDFNAPADSEAYKVAGAGLKDAWKTAAKRAGPEGTFNGFKGISTGPRIDWIFYRGALQAVEAETVTRNEEGRYPSDHFPVFAVLEWK